MNKNDYIKAVDNLKASDELKEKILKNSKPVKKNYRKYIIAAASFFIVIIAVGAFIIPNMTMGKSADSNQAEEKALINYDIAVAEDRELSVQDSHILFAVTALPDEEQTKVNTELSFWDYTEDGRNIAVHLIGDGFEYIVTVNEEDTEIISVEKE
jgi:hypothetical protein